jgi:hypothetical protein
MSEGVTEREQLLQQVIDIIESEEKFWWDAGEHARSQSAWTSADEYAYRGAQCNRIVKLIREKLFKTEARDRP